MTERKVITSYIRPPIPVRSCDWCAHFEDDGEEAHRYGWGETEEAAIKDLKQRYEDGEWE